MVGIEGLVSRLDTNVRRSFDWFLITMLWFSVVLIVVLALICFQFDKTAQTLHEGKQLNLSITDTP